MARQSSRAGYGALLLALTLCGCGGAPAAPTQTAALPPGGGPPPPPVAVPGQAPPPVAAPQPARVVEKAAVGMTKKGNYGSPDPISTPISAMWKAKERLVLIQVQQAMQFFETQEGRKPNSHAEFMDKVINANRIRLPELPPGDTYLYDPKQGELMVERTQY